MSYELCEKVRNLEPYEPIKGNYRIRLDANESFYNIPEEIKKEVHSIIDNIDFNRYPDPTAEKLIQSFSAFYDIDPDTVTASNGSDEMLYILSSAMLQRNSKVVVVEPDFSMYRFYSSISENQVISFSKSDSLQIDVDELIRTVNDNNADMLIFSNPCNPTGQGITAEDARKLVTSVNALVVLDEAYMDFWDQPLLCEAADYDNLIILKTASKAVGFAALRLGFAVSSKKITKALRAVKSPYNVNTLTQKIGTCVYSHKALLKGECRKIIDNTKQLYQEIQVMKDQYQLPFEIFQPCANFVLVRFDFAKDVFEYLLDKGIAVRFFANISALRITCGSEYENTEVLKYIERYILEKYITESH